MAKKKKEHRTFDFPFSRDNYRLIIIGIAIIILGFILMIGGGSDDPNVFNPEIFSFRRITLAPVMSMFGFVFIIYAIMKKPRENKNVQ
jgi:membrane-bound ClpP family serine protease